MSSFQSNNDGTIRLMKKEEERQLRYKTLMYLRIKNTFPAYFKQWHKMPVLWTYYLILTVVMNCLFYSIIASIILSYFLLVIYHFLCLFILNGHQWFKSHYFNLYNHYEKEKLSNAYVYADCEDRPAGIFMLDSDYPILRMHSVRVKEEYRRRGIGKKMVEFAKTQAKISKYERLQVTTADVNKNANSFYPALGLKMSPKPLFFFRTLPFVNFYENLYYYEP